jgi:peptidoglycan hydrolase-like protein with peptidoglycan-binding domain
MGRLRRLAAAAAIVSTLMAGTTALTVSSATAASVTERADFPAPIAVRCGYHDALTPPTIRYGSTGNAVREAQCLLRYRGFSVGSSGIDGRFGPDTLEATEDFQAECNISADGIIGPITWNRLRYGC